MSVRDLGDAAFHTHAAHVNGAHLGGCVLSWYCKRSAVKNSDSFRLSKAANIQKQVPACMSVPLPYKNRMQIPGTGESEAVGITCCNVAWECCLEHYHGQLQSTQQACHCGMQRSARIKQPQTISIPGASTDRTNHNKKFQQ